jgi:maltokinase
MTDLVTSLAEWLPAQRWFGAKGRPLHGVRIVTERRLVEGDPDCTHVIVEVDLGEDKESYQLLVGWRSTLPERLGHAVIDSSDGGVRYDAVHDSELTNVLLQLVAGDDDDDSGRALRFRHLPGAEVRTDLTSIVMGAEQSNTSLVFGDTYILKLFRKVAPGLNPDLEITRALAAAGSAHVVPPLGWLEAELADETTTLAMLQPYLRSASEGWALAVTSVRDLYAEADLRADEVGGDFAGESERLGVATAEVHALLARELPSRLADSSDNAVTAKLMHERLDAALSVVGELAPYADALRASYDELAELPAGVPVQRVHGDLHLGQALRTDTGWVIIDFEGEPARPLAERRALMSPLRDVAGMLRSFDYAARHLLAEQASSPQLHYRAWEWSERNQSAFCDGYAQASGHDPREEGVLLRAFEMDKAVYEVVYEARNRPSWLPIPLGSLERLTEVTS